MNHSWATREGWVVCTLCGLVRHHDRPESPCRGPAKIALREATGGEQGETAEMIEIVRLRSELAEMTGCATRWCAAAGRAGRERDEARTELEEVRAARDGALVKLECLDDHRRADSELIDRLTAALRNLVDSVTLEAGSVKSIGRNMARDLEAARELLGESRS